MRWRDRIVTIKINLKVYHFLVSISEACEACWVQSRSFILANFIRAHSIARLRSFDHIIFADTQPWWAYEFRLLRAEHSKFIKRAQTSLSVVFMLIAIIPWLLHLYVVCNEYLTILAIIPKWSLNHFLRFRSAFTRESDDSVGFVVESFKVNQMCRYMLVDGIEDFIALCRRLEVINCPIVVIEDRLDWFVYAFFNVLFELIFNDIFVVTIFVFLFVFS